MTFISFLLDQRINAGIKFCGFDIPTPIQQETIPLILNGYDVMGLAQTGTGKTAAFALPVLQKLLISSPTPRGPRVLILAPTRELAIQINESIASLAKHTQILSCIIMGGVSIGPQIKALRSSQIIVACPGRLVQLIDKGDVDLTAVDTLVLDEADRMLDMGFLPDLKRIITQLPAKRQNLLFSATMPKPILDFAKRILVDPKMVRVDATSPASGIKHYFYKTDTGNKVELLNQIISQSEHKSMLIFTRTKHKAKKLSRKLLNCGHNTTFMQGDMSQAQRDIALNGFRDGRYSIMVATDIVARGIDCDRITHVINYDMPSTAETYTHRIGRTGRAGRTGSAISLVTPDDAKQIRDIKKIMDVVFDPYKAIDSKGVCYDGKNKQRLSRSCSQRTYSRLKRAAA
ncbi:MAG: DEAD/DEAH box helicase [Desulfovibrio sp.]